MSDDKTTHAPLNGIDPRSDHAEEEPKIVVDVNPNTMVKHENGNTAIISITEHVSNVIDSNANSPSVPIEDSPISH